MLRAGRFLCFKRNGDNNSRADVRAAPTFSATPELQTNVEIFGCHGLYVLFTRVEQRTFKSLCRLVWFGKSWRMGRAQVGPASRSHWVYRLAPTAGIACTGLPRPKLHHVIPRQEACLEFTNLLLNQVARIVAKPYSGTRRRNYDHELIMSLWYKCLFIIFLAVGVLLQILYGNSSAPNAELRGWRLFASPA